MRCLVSVKPHSCDVGLHLTSGENGASADVMYDVHTFDTHSVYADVHRQLGVRFQDMREHVHLYGDVIL